MTLNDSGQYKIEECTFDQILPYWRDNLWPERISPIEPFSLINEDGKIDLKLQNSRVFFWKAVQLNSNDIIGCNSACLTSELAIRSRGIWIHPNFRRAGIATNLAHALFKTAFDLKCSKVWTMARQQSWPFYQKLGFTVRGQVTEYEYGPHYLADYLFKDPQT